jgi:hypothetical protein
MPEVNDIFATMSQNSLKFPLRQCRKSCEEKGLRSFETVSRDTVSKVSFATVLCDTVSKMSFATVSRDTVSKGTFATVSRDTVSKVCNPFYRHI